MKFKKLNKIKSIILTLLLTLGIFTTGCNNSNTDLNESNQTEISQESNQDSSNNDKNKPEDENKSDDKDDLKNDNQDSTSKNNGSSQPNSSTANLPSTATKATIERVVDGDTMKVNLNGETVTLRLLLIDTPESVKPGVEPQPYSIEASNFAKDILKEGDSVYLEYDNGDKTDKYDRHLVYLWYYNKDKSSWEMFNERIIKEGYARVGYIYSQRRHLDLLYKAQDEAKSNNKNIWSIDGYVTDKGFYADNNTNTSTSNSTANNNSSYKSEDSSSSSSSDTVYANGGASSSNKYHKTSNAHNMKGAIKMTEKEAKQKGYVPCGICYRNEPKTT